MTACTTNPMLRIDPTKEVKDSYMEDQDVTGGKIQEIWKDIPRQTENNTETLYNGQQIQCNPYQNPRCLFIFIFVKINKLIFKFI